MTPDEQPQPVAFRTKPNKRDSWDAIEWEDIRFHDHDYYIKNGWYIEYAYSHPPTSAASLDAVRVTGFEVRCNEDGTLDEVVGVGSVHLEQMDHGHWWLGLGDGQLLHVNLVARGKIKASVMDERRPAESSDVSTPRPTDCEDIRSGEVVVLARDADGNAGMTMRKTAPPK